MGAVRPQRKNANKHTPRGMGLLEGSIGQDGWIGAVTVAADGETFDGSARVEVIGANGMLDDAIVVETAGDRPVIVKRTDIPSADDPRAKRLGVAANQIAAANLSWDSAVLADLAQEIDLSGLFGDDELAALLGEAEVVPGGGDDAEPVLTEGETRCQLGDVWRVGEHLVCCLDSTEPANLDRALRGEKPGMVWADPPYGIDIVAADGYVGGGEKYDYPFGGVKKHPGAAAAKRLVAANGSDKPFGSRRTVIGTDGADHIVRAGRYAPVIGDDTTETARAAAQLYLAQFEDAVHIWWGANNYADELPPSTCWLVWDKENTGNFADAELAWSNHKSAVRIFKHMWNGMLRASEHGKRIHPTQKPVALCLWAFEKYGSAGDVILDPFLGSGPSLKAAHRMGDGRRVIGFELAPAYVDHILEWGDANGLTVERVETPMGL